MNQLPLLLPLQDELKAICSALVSGARYGVKIRLPHAVVMTGLFRRDLSAPDKLRSIVRLVREHATNLAAFAGLYKFILALLKWSSRRHYLIGQGAEGGDEIRPWLRSILGPISSMQRELPVGDGFNATTASTSSLATTNATSSSNVAPGRPEHPYHALVAGAIGGYFVWGRYSSINYQIVLYLTSRVLVGLWKRYWQTHDHDVQKTDWVQTALPDALKQRSYALGAATVWGLVMLLFESNPEVLHPSLKSSMDEIYR